MAMTNYMELLMANQPWNLILFMAVPMGLAEAIVASEFFSLYRAKEGSLALKINKKCLFPTYSFCARMAARLILPLWVLGKACTNSKERGALYSAAFFFAKNINSFSKAVLAV